MLLHEFVSRLKKEDSILIDVRTEEERKEQGFIEESVWIPMTNFLENFNSKGYSKSDNFMIFCFAGSRAKFVADILKENGYHHVEYLEDNVHDLLNSFVK